MGRAASATQIDDSVVVRARVHALQVVDLERRLKIFWELRFQEYFLKHDTVMWGINRIYSFVHIPGTILFLVGLYHYTRPYHYRTQDRLPLFRSPEDAKFLAPDPRLYEARRRMMAMCNLIAFVVFTAWPCMPPRLLRASDLVGRIDKSETHRTFVDSVHGANGARSVWTQNKFCNQYGTRGGFYSLFRSLEEAELTRIQPRFLRCTLDTR